MALVQSELATGYPRNTSHQMQCFPAPCSTPEHHLLTEIYYTVADRLSIGLTARQRGITLGISFLQIVHILPSVLPSSRIYLLQACHSCSKLLIHVFKEFRSIQDSTFMDPQLSELSLGSPWHNRSWKLKSCAHFNRAFNGVCFILAG